MGKNDSIESAVTGAVWSERFEMLDAWRGVAALAVVMFHCGLVRHYVGHNAVMIFFVISGYCIAASADSCARRGLGFRGYMWRRIRRIYPPYFFALIFFLVTRLVKYWSGGGWQSPETWVAWVQNFTLTQWLTLLNHPSSWAADNPTLTVAAFWSLNYEEQFYIVVGLLLVAVAVLRIPLWISASFLFSIAFAWNVYFPTIAYGVFIEYWVMFGVGCLVFFRLCRIRSWRVQKLIDASLLAMILASAYISWFAGFDWNPKLRLVYSEWLVVFSFALILILSRAWSGNMANWAIGRMLLKLGTVSYSLYLIHQFNLTSSDVISTHLLWSSAPVLLQKIVRVALLIALAVVFWYFCERPFLNKRLQADMKKLT